MTSRKTVTVGAPVGVVGLELPKEPGPRKTNIARYGSPQLFAAGKVKLVPNPTKKESKAGMVIVLA